MSLGTASTTGTIFASLAAMLLALNIAHLWQIARLCRHPQTYLLVSHQNKYE